ncbi:hypothetical protein VTN02DRAFT_3584 [Thermoascus thermophilus]
MCSLNAGRTPPPGQITRANQPRILAFPPTTFLDELFSFADMRASGSRQQHLMSVVLCRMFHDRSRIKRFNTKPSPPWTGHCLLCCSGCIPDSDVLVVQGSKDL